MCIADARHDDTTAGTLLPQIERAIMHIPTHTLIYLAAVFGILVIPRALQRFRLPAPLTCFALGIVVAIFYRPLLEDRVSLS